VSLESCRRKIITCRVCDRLVAWREESARTKRAAYSDDEYWGRPVPGWGDPDARLLIVGLAPAAHGANRTGRMFTGDRSGDWLYRAMHRAGFANRPESRGRDDGLELQDAFVTAVVRCAPPGNKPSTTERDNCLPFLIEEINCLSRLRVILALGSFAWDGVHRALAQLGHAPTSRIRFAHGAASHIGSYTVIASYHPSQQNTFTGRLTETMFDSVFRLAQTAIAQSM